ncbi:5-(carboxyamino)imidazole ribonucleotide synthase [Geminocystis sp. NIES-3709]|uniref:5-(carboxyamino)imidazole ribonucleotide synthase n=1 Tax=Geminocystis sp. NIES-3709 TaxID=1617448 RepID=UPI0005FC492C|nr:5-(carboxyamino)imidazole ribonucleotide synthase [Geminocystis sp. NIES-3709]BAQ63596.1 phosphoribosylaminoimidazole carboxylase ATPase subunit [Geminocystis sp. NIES-3709]
MTKKVGVIGGGQLAWMMAQVAPQEDIHLLVQTPSHNDPAVSLATKTIFAAIDDPQATAQLALDCDVITFENEFVNLLELQKLADQGVCFYPRLSSLSPLLDKYEQRCFLQNQGLPVPNFKAYESLDDFNSFSFPLVLKARRHGYDGQGTMIVNSSTELKAILAKFDGIPLLIEEFIPFDRELAIIGVRSVTGEIKIYPVVETYQQNQVCRWVIAPTRLTEIQQENINSIVEKLLIALDYVGVLGIELFLTKNGEILVNETAPRTHNSGHYTLDACYTSQFAMQLQAITGKKLGNIELKSSGAVMVNLLGFEVAYSDYQEKRAKIAQMGAFVHWYGKNESRWGRKLGHATMLLTKNTPEEIDQQGKLIAQQIESIWFDTPLSYIREL